jgi:hypothetical protein
MKKCKQAVISAKHIYGTFCQRDYEYTLENDQLTIDVIYGNKYRKTAHELDLRQLEVIAPPNHEAVIRNALQKAFHINKKILPFADISNITGSGMGKIRGDNRKFRLNVEFVVKPHL